MSFWWARTLPTRVFRLRHMRSRIGSSKLYPLGIFEGFTRNQETADTLEAIEDLEPESEIREALARRWMSPAGRA